MLIIPPRLHKKVVELNTYHKLSTIVTMLSKILRSVEPFWLSRCFYRQRSFRTTFPSLCQQQYYHGRNFRCPIRKIIVSSSLLSRVEPISRSFLKFALIRMPRERAKCENPSATRKADERTTLLGTIFEFMILAARITLVLFVTSGVFTFYLMTRIIYTKAFPGVLLRAIEFLGPTFIKLGQWASTRRDLFSEEVCRTLSHLQRHTPAHSWHYTKYLLERTYGPEWRNLFVKFDRFEPIGSGCCAQVYKAWIETKNASIRIPVAVKILHPGIENRLKRDLVILRCLSEWLSYTMPSLRWLNLPDCIRQFSTIMQNQLNMKLEAENLVKFSRNFSGNLHVIFPSPFMELTHERILVESFHDCSSISEFVDNGDRNVQRKLAKIGISAIFQMIFKDNFVHCDLHPGNILVEKKSRISHLGKIFPSYFGAEMRLVFLDCGLVASLDERGRKNLRDVFRSIVKGDGELAGQHIMNHSDHMSSDPEGFQRAIGNIVKNYRQSRLNLENIKMSSVVAKFFEAIIRYQVRQDGSFASVMLSIGVIEGLGRSLDPEIDIIAEVLPFVVRE